jgi:hypothetical protein
MRFAGLAQDISNRSVVALGSVVARVNAVVLEVLWTFILQVQVLQE